MTPIHATQPSPCDLTRPVRALLQVFTFNGAADDCIGCCLSLRTYARLVEAGYQLRMHIAPNVGHEGSTDTEVDLLCEALESWGLIAAGKIRW